MAAFLGSYAWLPRNVTTAQTDRRRIKWSLCAAMLCRRHKNTNEQANSNVRCLRVFQAKGKKIISCILLLIKSSPLKSILLVPVHTGIIYIHVLLSWVYLFRRLIESKSSLRERWGNLSECPRFAIHDEESWMLQILDTRMGFPSPSLNVAIDYFSFCLKLWKKI